MSVRTREEGYAAYFTSHSKLKNPSAETEKVSAQL